MDALTELLEGVRARGALLQQSALTPPWGLRFADGAPLALLMPVQGSAWVQLGDGDASEADGHLAVAGRPAGAPAARAPETAGPEQRVLLVPGAIAVVRGPEPYLVSDDPHTATQVVVHAGDRCTTTDGHPLQEELTLAPRTWGTDPAAPTRLITGQYQLQGMVSRRLLTALPRLLTLPPSANGSPRATLAALAGAEVSREVPGQQAIRDRLLDMLLSAALRDWFDHPGATVPGWLRAHRDPVAGRALRLMHQQPQRRWSTADLATETAVSRATLTRRFTQQLGQPPMTYLTEWRMTLAAELLHEPGATVAAVARRVGYDSAFAFSSAFKRTYGVSPRWFREETRSPTWPPAPAQPPADSGASHTALAPATAARQQSKD